MKVGILVNAKIDVSAHVAELSHRKARYVTAKVLQDNFHSVRVALCRCHNDRIGNKGNVREVRLFTIYYSKRVNGASEELPSLEELLVVAEDDS